MNPQREGRGALHLQTKQPLLPREGEEERGELQDGGGEDPGQDHGSRLLRREDPALGHQRDW